MRLIVISLLTGILLASCATTTRNWKSTDLPGRSTASFDYFNGKERYTVHLAKNDILFMKYSLAATSGDITLSVSHKGVAVWQKKVTRTGDTAEYHLIAPATGRYDITVSGEKAAGDFEIT